MITINLNQYEAMLLLTACNYMYIRDYDVLDDHDREAAYKNNDHVTAIKDKIKEAIKNENEN